MCGGGCGGKRKAEKAQQSQVKAAQELRYPGDEGMIMLEYLGMDIKTEYGPVTGARYLFWDANPRLVDVRDAVHMKLRTENGMQAFVEIRSAADNKVRSG